MRDAARPRKPKPNTKQRSGSRRSLRLRRSISPTFIGRRRGADGEGVLRAAIAASPKDAGLHYALGLALIRLKRSGDALTELQKAAELAPKNVHYAYVYGIALNSTGQSDQARKTLADAVARHPHNREILTALVQISQQAGDLDSALRYAESLATLTPNDENL